MDLYVNLHRVFHLNTEFRGDSLVFLLDKDGFLSEGLPESAYVAYMEHLEDINYSLRKTQSEPQERQLILSTQATDIAIHRKFFGYEYSGDIPLLKYKEYTKPGDRLPRVIIEDDMIITLVRPEHLSVVPDSVIVVPK
jgi:hypothetical protein